MSGQSLARLAAAEQGGDSNAVRVISDLEVISHESGTHSRRVAGRTHCFGMRLNIHGPQLDALRFAGLVHDIGKLGVPERILHKPAKLDEREYVIMSAHPAMGAELARLEHFSDKVIEVILYHHERWDGQGYPAKLAGENIPLFARIVAITDSFDTMISRRSYQDARAVEDAVAEIVRCAGSQFDPHLAKVFVKMQCERYKYLDGMFDDFISA